MLLPEISELIATAGVLTCRGLDRQVRWRGGERLEQLFEEHCNWMAADGSRDRIALSLLAIGDNCVLNAGSTIQCHSLKDGTFKSDQVTIKTGSTIGTGSFVHYGVVVGAGTVPDADAFLMKGSQSPPGSRWRGTPATELIGSARVADVARRVAFLTTGQLPKRTTSQRPY